MRIWQTVQGNQIYLYMSHRHAFSVVIFLLLQRAQQKNPPTGASKRDTDAISTDEETDRRARTVGRETAAAYWANSVLSRSVAVRVHQELCIRALRVSN